MKKGEAELIAGRYSPVNLDLRYAGMTRSPGRKRPFLLISEKGEGCACSMLTDNADWNDLAWDFRSEVLPDLALALLFISELASAGFNFQALWAGDKPKRELEVPLGELLEIVQRNQIGTRMRYTVTAA